MNKNLLRQALFALPLLVSIFLVGWVFFVKYLPNLQKSDNYNELIGEADQLYKEHEYSLAYSKYYEVVEKDSSFPDGYYGLNFILLDKGLNDKAEELVKKSEKNLEDKDISVLYQQIGDEYGVDFEWGKAVVMYKKSLEFDDKNSKSKLGLIKAQLKIGDISAAREGLKECSECESSEISVFKSFIQLSEQSNKDLYTLVDNGRVYVNNSLPSLAIQILTENSDGADEYWDYWYVLGKAYYDMGDKTNAKIAIQKADVLGSEDGGVSLILGLIAYEDNQKTAAYEYLDRAHSFADGELYELVDQRYVEILIKEEKFEDAISILNDFPVELNEVDQANVSDIFSRTAWRYSKLIEIYTLLNDFGSAGDVIANVAEGLSTDEEYLKSVCHYYISSGDIESASVALSKLKGFGEYNAYYYLYAAQIDLLSEKKDDALLNLEKSIEYDLVGDITPKAKLELERLQSS